MNIFRNCCLLGIILSSWLWGTDLITLRPWRSLSATAAEQVDFWYELLEYSVPVSSLETYAKTGKIDRSFAAYAQRLTPRELTRLKAVLNYQVDIERVVVFRFFHSSLGKRILRLAGEIIKINPNRNGFYGLRSALVLTANSPEGLTILNVIRQFPTESMHIDGNALIEQIQAFNQLRKQTTSAVATVEQQAEIEANTELKTDFARQLDLRDSGNSTWHKKTLTSFDQKRDRFLEIDFYRPAIDTSIPVVVISPGLGVDKDNFIYLAQHLASHGFAVAVLNHPGSDLQQFENFLAGTTKEVIGVKEFIDRPLDVSYLLDELTKLEQTDSSQLGSLNLKQVGIIGHSFGAYTALALAGVELNPKRLQQDCQSDRINLNGFNPSLLFQCLVLDLPPISDYRLFDKRIAAIFAMNPIASSIFGQQNLSQLDLPVAFVAGSNDPITPALPEQITPFTWLSVPNKYLLLIEKGTHIYKRDEAFSMLTASTDFSLARQYIQAMSLAFMKTYVAKESSYRLFLNSNYAKYIGKNYLKLNLVNSLSKTDLNSSD